MNHPQCSVLVLFLLPSGWTLRCLRQHTGRRIKHITRRGCPGCRGGRVLLVCCPRRLSPPRCLCSPTENWHILLHCSSTSSSTCSDSLTHLLHLWLTISLPQLRVQTSSDLLLLMLNFYLLSCCILNWITSIYRGLQTWFRCATLCCTRTQMHCLDWRSSQYLCGSKGWYIKH